MKIYRRHRCNRRHRTEHTWAQCAFPRAAWVAGSGPYAVLAWCQVLTVTLHETVNEAHAARKSIDGTGCGGRCQGRHEIVHILKDAP